MINIYSAKETDFASLGLTALEPIECTVEEQAGGKFELTLVHPIDDDLKWTYFQVGNILKAPCATRQTPLVRITDNVPAGTTATKTRAIYKVQTSTGERLRLRAKPSLSAKIISSYKPGTQVVRLSVSGDWARVVVRSGGATGYMWADDLVFVRNETETVTGSTTVETVSKVIEPVQTREQLFRIYSVAPDVKTNNVTSGRFSVIVYANGLWVAGSNSGEGLYYSTYGKTWTQSNVTNYYFSVIVYANDLWVAGNSSSKGLYYSTDGKTWTQSNVTSGDFKTIVYANYLWVPDLFQRLGQTDHCGDLIGGVALVDVKQRLIMHEFVHGGGVGQVFIHHIVSPVRPVVGLEHDLRVRKERLRLGDLRNYLIPVSPIVEQKRICNAIEQVLPLLAAL